MLICSGSRDVACPNGTDCKSLVLIEVAVFPNVQGFFNQDQGLAISPIWTSTVSCILWKIEYCQSGYYISMSTCARTLQILSSSSPKPILGNGRLNSKIVFCAIWILSWTVTLALFSNCMVIASTTIVETQLQQRIPHHACML